MTGLIVLVLAVAFISAVLRLRGRRPPPPPGPSAEGDADIVELVRNHQIIEAIKLYRERHGVDLASAKDAVDKLSGR